MSSYSIVYFSILYIFILSLNVDQWIRNKVSVLELLEVVALWEDYKDVPTDLE